MSIPHPIPTRQVFVLTDGEIENTKEVLSLVRSKRSQSRIFSIGLGSGADAGLINGLAEIANGSGIIVNSGDDDLTEKVIEMLENSIQPGISNISIMSEGMTEQWPSPSPALYNQSQQNFIIKSPYQEYVLISGAVADESIDETINVSKTNDDMGLKQLFMGKAIDDLQYEYMKSNDDKKKEKIIEYSLASQVLSEFTAYVGVDFESNVRSNQHSFRRIHISKPMRPMEFICLYAAEPKNFAIKNQSNDLLDEIIDSQNPNGSWSSCKGTVDAQISSTYSFDVAATVYAIAFILKNAGSKLNSLKLIIKKALNFLKKNYKDTDWEEIIQKEKARIEVHQNISAEDMETIFW